MPRQVEASCFDGGGGGGGGGFDMEAGTHTHYVITHTAKATHALESNRLTCRQQNDRIVMCDYADSKKSKPCMLHTCNSRRHIRYTPAESEIPVDRACAARKESRWVLSDH